MKTIIIVVAILALAGCCRNEHRFEKSMSAGEALDTKTGQLCRTTPHTPGDLPLCKDLLWELYR